MHKTTLPLTSCTNLTVAGSLDRSTHSFSIGVPADRSSPAAILKRYAAGRGYLGRSVRNRLRDPRPASRGANNSPRGGAELIFAGTVASRKRRAQRNNSRTSLAHLPA